MEVKLGLKIIIGLAAALLLLCPMESAAGVVDVNSTAAFLKIPAGARPAALGGMFVSVSDDANGVNWNPAGLTLLNKKEISAMYNIWFADITSQLISYVHPLNPKASMGLSLLRYGYGTFEKRDSTGVIGDFTAQDMAVTLSGSYKVSGSLRTGVNVKYVYMDIDSVTASAIALDAGVLYSLDKITLGLTLSNFGPKAKFSVKEENLPALVDAGVTIKMLGDRLAVTGGVKNYLYDKNTVVGAGAEMNLNKMLFLRAGYAYSLSGTVTGIKGLSGGAGIRVSGFQIDYAFVPFDELGNTHRVAVSSRF